MPVIVVANPKGGVGKSTLSTNIAGALAAAGHAVMLGDVDRQQSARQWLRLRPPGMAAITSWDLTDGDVVRPPKGTTHVVLDTPAGLHGKRLDTVMKIADKLLIPLQPSLFDIQATHAFVRELRQHRRGSEVKLGLVGMRVREHTRANEQLHAYLATVPVPVVAWLRDTQNYVQLAAHGLTLWDVAPSRVERDLEQWAPLRLAGVSGMTTYAHLADLAACVGQPIGSSDWVRVDQTRIDRFADATGDHQWIHVDPARAAAGPFGTPIAHGFLTLSLLPMLFDSGFAVADVRMGVNYGLNRVRFISPVKVGSRLRAHFKLLAYEPLDGGAQLTVEATIEIEGALKPACVAESVTRRYV